MARTNTIKQQQKKQKKTKKRKERKKKELARKAQWHRDNLYPHFEVLYGEGVEPEFVDALAEAADLVDFEDQTQIIDASRYQYQLMAKSGFSSVERVFDKFPLAFPNEDVQFLEAVMQEFRKQIDEAVFSHIPRAIKRRFMPYHHFFVVPRENTFQLMIRRLQKVSSPGGNLYIPERQAKVAIDGQEKTIAFTTHAIQRICERVSPRWLERFGDMLEVVRIIEHFKSFELTTLHPDQPAIEFRRDCGPTFTLFHEVYVEGVLGEDNFRPEVGPANFLFGYGPLVVDGPLAIVKTLLLPGYRGTPEYDLLKRSKIPYSEKSKLLELANLESYDLDESEKWIPVISWFHDNGIPQVSQGEFVGCSI